MKPQSRLAQFGVLFGGLAVLIGLQDMNQTVAKVCGAAFFGASVLYGLGLLGEGLGWLDWQRQLWWIKRQAARKCAERQVLVDRYRAARPEASEAELLGFSVISQEDAEATLCAVEGHDNRTVEQRRIDEQRIHERLAAAKDLLK
jgi:hypothetical protein